MADSITISAHSFSRASRGHWKNNRIISRVLLKNRKTAHRSKVVPRRGINDDADFEFLTRQSHNALGYSRDGSCL